MKHFKDLELKQRNEITSLLLKRDFKGFEEKLIAYTYFSNKTSYLLNKILFKIKIFLSKSALNAFEKTVNENITYLVDEIISHEVSGISSSLTPRISIEVLEYLFSKYKFNISIDTAFQSIRLTNNSVMGLILKEFDINVQNEDGETFLHKAATIQYTGACSFHPLEDPKTIDMPHSDDPEKIKTILQYNPDITMKNNDGKTALDRAEEFENYRVLEILENYQQRSIK